MVLSVGQWEGRLLRGVIDGLIPSGPAVLDYPVAPSFACEPHRQFVDGDPLCRSQESPLLVSWR